MQEANHDSFQYLTQNDINAIYSYLSTVKSKTPPKPKTGVGLKGGKKCMNNIVLVVMLPERVERLNSATQALGKH